MFQRLQSIWDELRPQRKANAPLGAALQTFRGDFGVGPEWQQSVYGEYYASSADVYAAVKLRAESVSRPPLVVNQRDSLGALRPVGPDHPVQRLGLNQRDIEWLAGLRWSLESVARVFGVPLPLLEDFSRATFNNVKEARRMFWEKTVIPELLFLQGEINEGLLPRLGRPAQDLQVVFDLSVIEALTENETERTRRHVELVKAGIMTVDEVRRERGLPNGASAACRMGSRRGGGGNLTYIGGTSIQS